jgi:hypothetical protein
MGKHLEAKKANASKTYAENVDQSKYRNEPVFKTTIAPSGTWASLMKDAAFYFDQPSLKDEVEMKRNLQREYDDLLPEGWRPALADRKSLLTWACVQREEAESAGDNCENYSGLLKKYGPDYESLRSKLGNVRGLFNDNDRHFN